jgi:uncharacterized protein YfcZ (UPF0381/DUF406 family)
MNYLRGDAFITQGCDNASIIAHIDDHVIKRSKGKKGNLYQLDRVDPPYEAFGVTVPDDIAQVLNLDEINFQGQLDAPFLFSLSSGDIARELNRVVALDLIDSSLANIASEVRRANDSVKTSQERLALAENKCQELGWVQQADQALQKLERVYQQVQDAQEVVEDLKSLIVEIEALQSALDGDEQTIITLGELVAAGQVVYDAREEIEELETLLETAQQYQDEISDLERQGYDLEHELREMAGERCPLCGLEGGDLL